MAVRCVRSSKFDTIHENRFWNKLKSVLDEEFSNSQEDLLLVGNIIIDGKQIDALCIKNDAIVVIDFKDYSGNLSISENSTWTISGEPINSGGKNPYIQLSAHKYAVLNQLKRRLPDGYQNWINIGHINALVLFQQHIEYDITNIQYDLSPSVSKWFNICDLKHVCQTLDEITSDSTLIKGENRKTLIEALGVTEIVNGGDISHEDDELAESPIETTNPKPVIGEPTEKSFADAYYQEATSLEKIKMLIIGQDPYPSKANGVAFCKDWRYELYQADCCGGTVLNSLGFSESYAKENHKNPREMFRYLLTHKGICFTNINQKQFNKLTTEEIEESVQATRDFNMPLVEKAHCIVLLGKSKTREYFEKYYSGFKPDYVLIHPSGLARAIDENEWDETWATTRLKQILESLG